MKATLLSLAAVLFVASPLFGQADSSDDGDIEIVAIIRPAMLVGVQAEYAGERHLAPWLSARYGTQNISCKTGLLGDDDCGNRGLSVLAGLRFKAGPWGPVEPYVTAGVGGLWYGEGEVGPDVEVPEPTGTLDLGLEWVGFGPVRPRIEFGIESHTGPWMNLGIGFLP